MRDLLEIILGSLAFAAIVAANVLAYVVKFAIRKKGCPVSWIHYPGMRNDLASLRDTIANAQSPEEEQIYRRWLFCFYLQYVVFGLGLAIFFCYWIPGAFRS